MVAPVTGPFTKDTFLKGPPNKYGYTPDWTLKSINWYRQHKPYDRPLGWEMTLRTVLSMLDSWNDSRDYSFAPPYSSSQMTYATNKAYAKLVSGLGDSSLWATNFLEMHQSISMIVNRSNQIRRFTKKLNHFDFPGASRELKLAFVPKGASKAKSLANNWLEYHFGWEPLVKDIGAAIETVTNPFKSKRLKGSGSSSLEQTVSGSGFRAVTKTISSCRMQAEARVSNPNALLLSQLGFVNPASVVWEAIPFSFVVDWFANVGQVLSSMTDFVGVELINPFTTTKQQIDDTYTGYTYDSHGIRYVNQSVVTRSVYVKRTLGITGPTLTFRPFQGLSVIRGATAISLLLQQMKR